MGLEGSVQGEAGLGEIGVKADRKSHRHRPK